MPLVTIPPIRYDSEAMDLRTLSQTFDWGQREQNLDENLTKTEGEGTLTIICDTGVPQHSDLPTPVFEHNFSRNGKYDRNGHQTHCAGIICAQNNSEGVIGWSPKTDIGHIKVLNDSGSGSTSQIIAGIRKGIEEWKARKADYNGCTMSLSIGGPYSREESLACEDAEAEGIIINAAAGNSGANAGIDSPGNFPSTICIAAYRSDGNIARFSSGGPEVDFAFPGEQILSTYLNNTYRVLSGTSMATPASAGTTNLILASHPHLTSLRTVQGMKDHMALNADDRGNPGEDNRFGIGVPSLNTTVRDQEYWFF